MKLAILAQGSLLDSTVSINGTLVQLHNLSLGFAKSGLDVHYISITNDGEKPNYELVNGIHFHWIFSKKGVLGWYLNMSFYQEALNAILPDVIYVRGRNVMQYIAGKYAKEHGINYVWGTNGEDSAELWKNLKRLKKSKKSFVKKIALFPLKAFEDNYINKGMKLTTTIINQSIHQQKETIRLLGKEGVLLPSYFIQAEHKGIKENTILWLANLSPSKQPNLFVKLINQTDLKGWKAVLGGGTSLTHYKKEIGNLIENDSLAMTGQIAFEDSFKYYSLSKIYVNTSKPDADGLPNAYIQSWLNGTVVLSLHHDPNGWMETYNIGFCAHGDFNTLQNRLEYLIENPSLLKDMSYNSVKFATETFSNQSIIDHYIKLFEV